MPSTELYSRWDLINGTKLLCISVQVYLVIYKKQEVCQDSGSPVQDLRRRGKLQCRALKNLICFLGGGVGVGYLDGRIRFWS